MVKYSLGNCTFKNWAEASKHAQEILSKGCRDLLGDELNFMLSFFEYHPHAESKLQHGVSKISVSRPSYGSGFCFKLTNKNGFTDEISYKTCRPMTKKNPELAIKMHLKEKRFKAYRTAILDDINQYSISQSQNICTCCSTKLGLQVDHVKPFVSLLNEFESKYSITEHPNIEANEDNPIHIFRFSTNNEKDHLFVKNWQAFHKENATLQLLCHRCNSSKNSEGARYRKAS